MLRIKISINNPNANISLLFLKKVKIINVKIGISETIIPEIKITIKWYLNCITFFILIRSSVEKSLKNKINKRKKVELIPFL